MSQTHTLTPEKFHMLFLSSADFFQNQLFGKILSGIPSECQTVGSRSGLTFSLGITYKGAQRQEAYKCHMDHRLGHVRSQHSLGHEASSVTDAACIF